jgi:hypothetical protein
MPSARAEKPSRVESIVEWQIDATPIRVRIVAAVQFIAFGAMDLMAGTGAVSDRPAGLRSPRLPRQGEEVLDLEPASIAGTAPWMPPEWAGPQQLQCYVSGATINPTGIEGRAVNVPLEGLQVTACRPKNRFTRGRHATARWALVVTGDAQQLTLIGPWLTLAWLGHLGGWAEPPR